MWMYKCYKEGISPNEFRKCQIRDIRDIMEINDAMIEKSMREAKINELKSSMR